MYDTSFRKQALALAAAGHPLGSVAIEMGIARSTLRDWLADPEVALRGRIDPRCWRCCDNPAREPAAYAYLLGQYLGDGHLVTRARTPVLRIAACTDYPLVLGQAVIAIELTRGRRPGLVRRTDSTRVVNVQSYWTHWPCVLPQLGPGMKHNRPILLTEWQRAIVAEHPWPLVRGLIHSDGCRSLNRVTVRGKTYEYPRYLFANESRDILTIFGDTLDCVGVAWRYNRPNSISVARREAVALMDHHVGPKC